MNRASGTRGAISKGLTFVSLESQTEKRTLSAQKILEDIMAESFLNLVKDIYIIKKLSKPQGPAEWHNG